MEQIVTAAGTQTLAIFACADLLMNPDRMPKLDQSDLLYVSKSPAEKSGRE